MVARAGRLARLFHRQGRLCHGNGKEKEPRDLPRLCECVALHLSLHAPSALVDLPLDKGRLFGADLDGIGTLWSQLAFEVDVVGL